MSEKKTAIKINTTDSSLFSSIQLHDAYTDFILSRQAALLSPRTIEYYLLMLGTFITWAVSQNISSPSEITSRHIRQFQSEQQSRNLSDYTIHGYARAIRAFLHFALAEGYISAIPKIEMPKIKRRRLPSLDAETAMKLLAACNKRDRAIILFAIDSGLRLSELIHITQGDVNIRSGHVQVTNGKGGKDRTVAIGATTRRAIIQYMAEPDYDRDPTAALLQTQDGRPFSRDGLAQVFKRLSKRTGIQFSAHALRRTFAILALRAGMNPMVVQDLMGHSDITMTKRYAQMVDDDLITNHRAHSPIDNLKKLK